MTESTRTERQLVRQRGAADRDIEAADFDFVFGVDSREDRQLMRQRGAGARQVDSVDFGFHFATPSTVRSRRSRIGSRSPGIVIQQHNEQDRPTPKPISGMQALQSDKSVHSLRSKGINESSPSRPPPKKRRRLSEISNMTRASSVPLASAEPYSDVSEARESEKILVQPQECLPCSPHFATERSNTSSLIKKENDSSLLSNTSKTSTKRRKRKSIGQQAMRKRKRRTDSVQPLPTPPKTQNEGAESAEHIRDPSSENIADIRPFRESRRWSVRSHESGQGPPTQVLQSFPVRTSQESDVQTRSPPTGHPSPEPTNSTSETPILSIEEDNLEDNVLHDDAEPDELSFEFTHTNDRLHDNEDSKTTNDEGEYLSEQDHTEPPPPRTAHLRPHSDPPDMSRVGDDEEADEDYLPDSGAPEKTSAAKVAKKKKLGEKEIASRRVHARRRSEASREQRQRRKSAVPILTYRITNIHTLPTIDEAVQEDDLNSDADELMTAPPAFTIRKSPNAVDVLRQACHEAIDTQIGDLQSSTLSRADLNNCTIALQTFKTALHTQLFQISQSLDHRLNLEARLRKSRREKAALQARWLEIRQQRDRLDLQKDEVRRKCWEDQILDEKRFQASQAAFALEHSTAGEAENEDVAHKPGLELRLRTLAKDVSSQAGGGILQTLKNFNAMLEKLANTAT